MFEVSISGAELMQLFKDAGVSPTGKAFIDRIPIAVFFGKQSPLRAEARNPMDGRPAFNLAPTIAEKIEGLAWGPDLADGRQVLYVISDNDLNPDLKTQIYAFAIDASLLNFERQFLPGPLYPPGQVKKALR